MTENQNFLTTPPEPLPTRPIKLPTAYETTLANGLRVVVVEDQRLPLISYRLSLRTGDAHNPSGSPGLMDMLTGLLTEGTESRTSREIADEVARLGATLPRPGPVPTTPPSLHHRSRSSATKSSN